MSPIGSLTALPPLFGKPGTPGLGLTPTSAPAQAGAPQTERPVPPVEAGQRLGPTAKDDPGYAARRTLAAAVRNAALREMRAGVADPAEGQGEDDPLASPQGPRAALLLGELMARVTSRAALPLLPEPPTPAREAFAEAIVALRSGIKRNGTAEGGRT